MSSPDKLGWIARSGSGKFRLGTADQLLRCTEVLRRSLPFVNFPFCAVHSTHDEAVLPHGCAMLLAEAATPAEHKAFHEVTARGSGMSVWADGVRRGAANPAHTVIDTAVPEGCVIRFMHLVRESE
jgi:hypothetical protein